MGAFFSAILFSFFVFLTLGNDIAHAIAGEMIYEKYTAGPGYGEIYKKRYDETGDGDKINTGFYARYPTYSPDGQSIVYVNASDGNKLYKKPANDNSDGSAITSVGAGAPTYSPDGQWIVYRRASDGILYRKPANDNSDGSAITSVGGGAPIYSPDGQWIVYSASGNDELYKKSANDTSNGNPLVTGSAIYNSYYAAYSPDGQWIVYTNGLAGGRLYRKPANDGTAGSAINSVNNTGFPAYSPDGQWIVYQNPSDGAKIYRKPANDNSNGSAITSSRGDHSSFYPSSGTSVSGPDQFTQCDELSYYTAYSEIPQWGNMPLTSSGGYGESGNGIWDGFLNLFREEQTTGNKYYRGLYSSGSSLDTLVFQYLGDSVLGDPYRSSGSTMITGSKDTFVTIRSITAGKTNNIDGLSVLVESAYSSGTYGMVHFYDFTDREIFSTPMMPYSYAGTNRIGAFYPWNGTNKPVKAIWTGISGLSFRGIIPMIGTGSAKKTSCKNNSTFCGWRSMDGLNAMPLACVNEEHFFSDPFGVEEVQLCTASGTTVCLPKAITGTYLGVDGVKTSLLVGGNGAYYLDSSGTLRFDQNRQKIGGISGSNQGYSCDTFGLSWYESIWKNVSCIWERVTKPASDSVNTATNLTAPAKDALDKTASGASSGISRINTSGTGDVSRALPMIAIGNSKGAGDLPGGVGRLLLGILAFVMVAFGSGIIVFFLLAKK